MHLQHFMIIAIEQRSEVRNKTKKESNKGNRQARICKDPEAPNSKTASTTCTA